MTMEEMWNMRESSTKASAHTGPSATSEFNVDPGQFSHPYMAKEVCVIERTYRQEPMLTNSVTNFGSQGLHPEKLRTEAPSPGSQQHVATPSYCSTLTGRSPCAVSLSQFSQISDLGGYSGWPSQSASFLLQSNRGNGGARSSSGADAALGQGRDFSSVMSGWRTQDCLQAVNGSRAPAAEVLTHSSLSYGRGAGDFGMEAATLHLPSSQWSTEPATRRQHRIQSNASLFSTDIGDPNKSNASAQLNATGSGFLSQSQWTPTMASSGLRVYCIGSVRVPVVGQLGLTDTGRLGVTCSCHSQHMSVAKFTQHSGLNATNPGEVVFMEGGETLVQWRQSFFSQYGVKVPEDRVGWEWLDLASPLESGHSDGKYVTGALPPDVKYTTFCQLRVTDSAALKGRLTTQHMSLSNGNASTFPAMESISNTKFGLLSGFGNNKGMMHSRDAALKSCGQSHRSMAADLAPGIQLYSASSTHENHSSRAQVSMGSSNLIQSMGHVADSIGNSGLLSNSGYPRCNPSTGHHQKQQHVSGGSRTEENHLGVTRVNETGQVSLMREADISSSFELRLGQPSQQTSAAGTSFCSIAMSNEKNPKSHLFENRMNKVWDGKLPSNSQQFNPSSMPKFSGVIGQMRDPQAALQWVHGRAAGLEKGFFERHGEGRGNGRGSASIPPTMSQATRQVSRNATQAGFRAEGVSELQENLVSMQSMQNQSDTSSKSGGCQFRREPSGWSENVVAKLLPHASVGPSQSVALENKTTLESLSTGAMELLSRKTGQRLFETAIRSSFSYRLMGQEGPASAASHLNAVVPSTCSVENELFGQLDVFGRSSCVTGQRASFQEILVRSQNEFELRYGLGLGSGNKASSRVEQDPNIREFQIRDHPNLTFRKHQHAVQRQVMEELSERTNMVEPRGVSYLHREPQIRQNLCTARNGIDWRSEEQQGPMMDGPCRDWVLAGSEVENMAYPRVDHGLSRVKNCAVIASRMSQGDAEGESKDGEHSDVQSEPLAGGIARSLAADAVSSEEGLEGLALSEGNVQCVCLKCRKASPSVRGQAVPRLLGQICLKDKAGLASMMDAARNAALVEGELNEVEVCALIERPAQVDMVAGKRHSEEAAQRDDKGTPENEDLVSDAAAEGTTAATGRCIPEASFDVGVSSNSSEDVSSGLSDGGCVLSEKESPGLMRGSGGTGIHGVVDEGSGIGKCCSSGGVDMVVGRQTNALSSTLEDHCNLEGSPSSLGCPSSSNIRQRLVARRVGMRGLVGSQERTEMELDNEAGGDEPTASTGKSERKPKRSSNWKWLGSGGAHEADLKQSSPDQFSFGQEAEAQDISGTARVGSKNVQEVVMRPGDLKRDLVWGGEMIPSSKRRKLLVPRRHQEVKATIVTEKNFEAVARSLGDDLSKKAGSTLVIRVPQGVNRQNATMGMQSKFRQLSKFRSPRDWRADAGEEGRDGRSDFAPAKSQVSRSRMEYVFGSGSGFGRPDVVSVPSFLTKSNRCLRTPLAGPTPRSRRMVSLSVILNQPAAASPPLPRSVEFSVVHKSTDLFSNSISRSEGKTMHKRPEIRVGSADGVLGGHVKEVKSRGRLPGTGVSGKSIEVSRTRAVHRKEDAQSRKVRSMLELTGKNDGDVRGLGSSSVFEFAEETHVDSVLRVPGKHHATVSGVTQIDSPAAGRGRVGANSCSFPRGERSVRPGILKRRKLEWHRSKDAQAEAPEKILTAGGQKDPSEKGWTFDCKVSLVKSTAGGSISKEHQQQGCIGEGFPIRKQVRSSKAKRRNAAREEGTPPKLGRGGRAERVVVADNQMGRQLQVVGQGKVQLQSTGNGKGQLLSGVTGNGVLKRGPALALAGMSTKRPRVLFGVKKVKEGVVEGAVASEELFKSSTLRGVEHNKPEMLVGDLVADWSKVRNREKPEQLDVNGRVFTSRKERGGFGVPGNKLAQTEKCRCEVCGTCNSTSFNKLLGCGRCPVKVHQACYGVPKIPKGPWLCRICKFKVNNPICVLCGNGGGAMTRVQKARPLCQSLLQTWQELRFENACAPVLEEDDGVTLLSATNSMQLSGAKFSGGLTGMHEKKLETKVMECDSCESAELRDEGLMCKVCGQECPEPGSSSSRCVSGLERGAVAASLVREDWRRSNTVESIVTDVGSKQWAHMVCTLWMPGTRCLNMGTMGVFDVSGVTQSRRKALCSMCQRKGGACIQCRVPKCTTPFHVWCAHERGLLQSEIVQDGSNQVGFFGKCQWHADFCASEVDDETKEDLNSASREVCARTEGYRGRMSLEERADAQQRMILEGFATVTSEQVAAWLRIDERKLASRRCVKPANSSVNCDQREYLRFKHRKGWKKLGVYKSGIHALGLYTSDFIAEGEVVVEYVGEIVGLRVADKREAEYHSGKRLQYQGACYLFRIDTEQIIDATRTGGIARFVNHSCSPNCVAKVICVENLKKVVFFAKRDIYAKEEITYDYKFNCDEVGDKIPCFCGTPECRGTLN